MSDYFSCEMEPIEPQPCYVLTTDKGSRFWTGSEGGYTWTDNKDDAELFFDRTKSEMVAGAIKLRTGVQATVVQA